jgi:hypothetical protein
MTDMPNFGSTLPTRISWNLHSKDQSISFFISRHPETVLPGPQHEHLLSKLTFFDEVTGETYHEYIEPMIGHLRFPLQKCMHPSPVTPQYKSNYISFRGWIIPPPPVVRGDRALLFDAASTSWESKQRYHSSLYCGYLVSPWFRDGPCICV